jgi:hypothetical protein
MIVPDAPVPTKNIPTNSPPKELAIAMQVFCYNEFKNPRKKMIAKLI